MKFFALRFLGIGLMLIALNGCDSVGGNYVPVSGIVTMNGQPLANVQVTFQPMSTGKGGDAGGVGSFAMTDAQGRYTLEASTPTPRKGAYVGKHKVRIATPPNKLQGNSDSDAAHGSSAAMKDPIPARYNTETTLEFEVPKGGTDKADFALTTP
jgi:hypothetical protein